MPYIHQHAWWLAGRTANSSCRRKFQSTQFSERFFKCLNYSNLGGELELPGRDEKDGKASKQENRTGRINLSGWKGELPRGDMEAEALELLGAKGWKADILQEVNIVRAWKNSSCSSTSLLSPRQLASRSPDPQQLPAPPTARARQSRLDQQQREKKVKSQRSWTKLIPTFPKRSSGGHLTWAQNCFLGD